MLTKQSLPNSKISVYRLPKDSDNRFAMVDRRFLSDDHLSWEAKGLLVYLLSMPNDWSFHPKEIRTHGPAGRDKFSRMLRELECAGYIRRSKWRDASGKWRWAWEVFESPELSESAYFEEFTETENPSVANFEKSTVTEKPFTVKPSPEKPFTEDPFTENPSIYLDCQTNTDSTNTDWTNTEAQRGDNFMHDTAVHEIGGPTLVHEDVPGASPQPVADLDLSNSRSFFAADSVSSIESRNVSSLEVKPFVSTASVATSDTAAAPANVMQISSVLQAIATSAAEASVSPNAYMPQGAASGGDSRQTLTVEAEAARENTRDDFNERAEARRAAVNKALAIAGFNSVEGEQDAYERGEGEERVVIRRAFGSWRVYATTISSLTGKSILVLETQHDTVELAIDATARNNIDSGYTSVDAATAVAA